MDNTPDNLAAFLSSPETAAKLSDMLAALGASAPSVPTAAPDTSPQPPAGEPNGEALGDLSGLLKLAPLLSSMGEDDQNTVLLKALRPYLHGTREKRLDDSVKLMQLLKFLPLLQERGLFQ